VNFTTNADPIGGFGALEVAEDGSVVQMTTAQATSLTSISFTNPSGSSAEQVKFHATAGTTSLNLSPLTITGVTASDQFYLYGNADANAFYGTAYADIISGGDGADYLSGEAGNDSISGDEGDDTLAGGAGDDTITGGEGADSLIGGAGNDTFIFNVGDMVNGETLTDSSGDTTIQTKSGTVDLTGGLISLAAGGAHTLEMAEDGTVLLSWDHFEGLSPEGLTIVGTEAGVETVEFQSLNNGNTFTPDTIVNGEGFNENDILRFIGDSGGDPNIMDYSGYSDDHRLTINMVTGSTVDEFAGSPKQYFTGIEGVIGGGGSDTIIGALASDTLDGGAGGGDGNTISYAPSTVGVTINLANNTASDGNNSDTLANFQNAVGGSENDMIIGDAEDNSLTGGAGDDSLTGGAGDDTLTGGEGTDVANYAAATTGLDITLSGGAATVDATGSSLGTDTLSEIEGVIGGSGDDTLTGDDGDNTFVGNAGVDNITGGDGIDTLDYFTEGGSRSIRIYDDGDWCIDDTDSIHNTHDVVSGIERIILNNADYSANFSGGYAVTTALLGGICGSDTFTLDGSHLSGFVLNADFSQVSTDYNISLIGGAGNDTLTGGAGNDTIEGMGGDDLLRGGSDTISGHDGLDTVSYEHAQGTVTVDLSSGTASGDAGNDTLSGFESLIGSAFADILTGNDYANLIQGGDGDDTLAGGDGADTLEGGAGNDYFEDGAGNDVLYGGDGNDEFMADAGDDVLNGGAGSDTAVYVYSSALTVTLVNGAATVNATDSGLGTDTLSGIENLIGGYGNDSFTGDGNDNYFAGQGGDDTLIGGAGDDTLMGGEGDDSLTGGDGTDTASYVDATENLEITLTNGSAEVTTSALGTDTLSGIENLIGGSGDDSLTGDDNANRLMGGYGWDTLDGGGGSDTADYSDAFIGLDLSITLNSDGDATVNAGDLGHDTLISIENLIGGLGDDTLTGNQEANIFQGGDGADVLFGNGGADSLTGGNGSDIFQFASTDGTSTITDFSSSDSDLLKFLAIDDFADLLGDWHFDTNTCTTDMATLLFCENDHTLYYDADGTGTDSTATAIATFSNNAAIVEADITVLTP